MSRFFAFVYGCVVYLFFLVTFLYLIGFLAGIPGLKTIDSGAAGDAWSAALADFSLLVLFGLQHSVMARRAFKQWSARAVPGSVERSTFVLASSLVLALVIWQWQPLPSAVWAITDARVAAALYAVSALGWVVLLLSTFLLNHFELFGLRQVYARLRERRIPDPTFRLPLFYRYVRHPLYAGFLMAFWSAPLMSVGHLLFSIVMTAYILIGVFFEERDLIAQFGDEYRRYREEVGMLVPRPSRGRAAAIGAPGKTQAP